MNWDHEKLARSYNPELKEQDEAIDLAIKTAELIKKSGFDKTLKELEKDD